MKKAWIVVAATTAALGALAALARKKEQEKEEEILEPMPDSVPEEAVAPIVLEEEADEDTYYWAEKGGVWHSIPTCGYLARTEKLQSGTLEQAKRAGKTRACASCAL